MKPIIITICKSPSASDGNEVILDPAAITVFEDRGKDIEVPHRFKIRTQSGHYDVDEDTYRTALMEWKSYLAMA